MVILAHPREDSFNGALAKALCRGVTEAGHEVDLADLYAEGFRPELTREDLAALERGHAPPDLQSYRERVAAAEGLAFVFPVWWFGMPAMVKGFVDRVLFEGFAFRFKASGLPEGLLGARMALVINTTGMHAALYKAGGFGRPLARAFDEWTLKTVGIKEVKRVLFHDVVKANPSTRRRYLEKTRALGRDYFE